MKFTDEGDDEFSYEGKLSVVLTYPHDKVEVSSLGGVFEGIYPRYDRMRNRNMQIPLLEAFESIPEEGHHERQHECQAIVLDDTS